jgi:hypothetical protein
MSNARKSRTSAAAANAAVDQSWTVFAMAAAGFAVLAAAATALDVVPTPVGLALTIVGLLALLAERGLVKAASAGRLAAAAGIGLAWVAICYAPFHALLFPGAPLHQPIRLKAADPALPVTISTAGSRAVDFVLEGELPANPGGGAPIPVDYSLVFQDSAAAPHVIAGRFDDSTRRVRRGRRGSATVLQPHHEERHMLENPADGDLVVTTVNLEPAPGSAITLTAYRHRLPSTGVLALLGAVFLAAVTAADALFVPASDGVLTILTPAVLGTGLIFWTSNTAHLNLWSLIGAIILGSPLGLAFGWLLRTLGRRSFARG